jgi:hypothetical protein
METIDARSALEAKHYAEAQIAKAANCPPWRHAVFGLMMGGLVASFAFEFMIRTAILVVILAAIPIIIHSDRKRMGMFINGYRRGKTRYVIAGFMLLWLPLYGFSVYYGLTLHNHVMPLVLGLVTGILGVVASRIWQRVFVSEMGA